LFGGQLLMLQVKMIKNWRNLKISYILTLFDLQWLKSTFKQQIFYIFGISEQFAMLKSTISIYRATSIFGLHMRIFNLQGLGAPDKPKIKKNSVRRNWFYISPQLWLRKVKKKSIWNYPILKKPSLVLIIEFLLLFL
jgi:hypothetical protein